MPNANVIGWGLAAILPTMFAVAVRNFHVYWSEHKRKYAKAQLFLNSNACLDSGMKAALAEFNLCDSAIKILDVPPTLAAWYDVLEDLNICGHGRCMRVYSDMTTKLPLIFMMSVIFGYTIYLCVQNHRHKSSMEYYVLPGHDPFADKQLLLNKQKDK